jgi:hypothetical protein
MTSTLNPHAASFIPGAFLKAEDFSPEWYALVKENPAFSNFWLRARFEVMDDGCELSGSDVEFEAAGENLLHAVCHLLQEVFMK